MSEKEIKYTNESIGEIEFINDFLPPPEQLVLKEETVKITLALTKDSVDFFKKIAREQDSHYQTMIRSLLDSYTEHFATGEKVAQKARKARPGRALSHKESKISAKKGT